MISAPKTKSGPSKADKITPQNAVAHLEQHILVDGFKIVIDLERSHGPYLVDATTGREYIDMYSFYASMPVGFNHPHFDRPDVQADLLAASKIKVASADVYSVQFATFVDTFARVVPALPLNRYFFIDGGAAAVENALKAAMDWKVRKNIAAGRGERGTEIIHFQRAFHGRSGYTMSLTNTDPRKTDYFAKFPWPRIITPCIDNTLPEAEQLPNVVQNEKEAEAQIRKVIKEKGHDIAAIIIEPIQGEGGDNHFRKEWLQTLRTICDENDIILIYDEVQVGMGVTGKHWCWQHFDVPPDIMAFGKKAQVCGIIAGPRMDEVPDNVFRMPSRINSTWGGNFCDYVRSTHLLHIYERENLPENARKMGEFFTSELQRLAKKHPMIQAIRSRGLLVSFTMPNAEMRNRFWTGAYEVGLLVLRCGERSIRLRPALNITQDVIEKSIALIEEQCRKMGG
ncbi:MAG: L-lysine 6-transaminase [Verrucomicrobiales bacterium]|nr:L-lysine 6-transaminase [Verrucomicrobiales bacterium]